MWLWKLLREAGLTALGMLAIYTQIFSPKPNGLILGTGLALTVPSVAAHVKALLPSAGESESSEQQPSRGSGSLSGGRSGD